MKSRLGLASVATALAFGLGCGAPQSQPVPAAPAPLASAPPPPPFTDGFKNPGGLWLPEQVPGEAQTLKNLGLKLDPKELSDPLSGVLGAIVNIGGCSASFVSPDGLIATNHHCAVAALQYNSTPGENLLRDGFLAAAPSAERWSGPTGRVFVTRSLTEVSDKLRAVLASVTDDLERERALERFEKETLAACEKDKPGLRCELKSFYGGLRYYVVEKLELKDVRLVYAPPAGIGNYGGEIDNWRWPRHTGDFALFRAYVGKDKLPAEHAADNVAYRPPHHLELAAAPLAEGDLVIVAGYPGRTSMLTVAKEVENTVTFTYPRRLDMFDAYIAVIEQLSESDADVKIKGTSWLRRFSNYRTKHRGELEGFERGKLLEQKQTEERSLREFIAADPKRQAEYGTALDAINTAIATRDVSREADVALQTEILLPRVMWAASLIVRMAEERAKPDAERDPSYQERKVPDLRDELDSLEKRYHPKLDQAFLALALDRVNKTAPAQQTPALALIAGKNPTPESIQKAVVKLYAGTKLTDPTRRRELFDKATPAELARSTDPMLRLAVQLRPLLRAIEERNDRFAGKMLLEEPRYMAALLAQKGGRVAPDANGTLRLSYGVVRKPADGNGRGFTRLSEVVQKNTGKEPFDAPPALLEAVKAKRFGTYVDPKLGDVPVNFLSDVQITNGNSGSATLDASGRLTGLAFDGTYESVASDWVFLPTTRSIHVDVRYLLWTLDAVSNAEWILRELGVKPRVEH
jgi:hypothetical protein